MKLIPVLAACATDALQATRLLDLIALYRNKKPQGHILLAYAPGLHQEMQNQLKVAAEIGFETVDQFMVGPSPESAKDKASGLNNVFQKTAQHCGRTYRWNFLWLEPDCVPLKPSWLNDIAAAYDAQPKHYMSSYLTNPKDGNKCIGRVGVYPRHAATDLNTFFANNMPFEIAAGEPLRLRTTKTQLIQTLPILTIEDRAKVKPEAVLVHWDKAAILLRALMHEFGEKSRTNGNGLELNRLGGPLQGVITEHRPRSFGAVEFNPREFDVAGTIPQEPRVTTIDNSGQGPIMLPNVDIKTTSPLADAVNREVKRLDGRSKEARAMMKAKENA